MSTFFARIILGCPLLLAACGSPFGEAHRFKDEGTVCVSPTGQPAEPFASQLPAAPVTFEGDRPVEILVQMPTCLSSSCSKELRASCEVKLAGPGELVVTSSGSYVEEGTTCTADCRALFARCTSPTLPAGTYSVRHGDDRLTVTVPSTAVRPCTPPPR
jgi:hypothetical protein